MSKTARPFKTEVQQLLDLVIHSLYSRKEIFLRELVSNASDAIDRLRFEGLSHKELLDEGEEWKIRIAVDPAARTLTVADNGIGMNAADLDAHLGTIANSGTRNFLQALKAAGSPSNLELIGQFGVGFYASFMVADEVRVLTRKAGETQGWLWVSTGDGTYTVEEAQQVGRGSQVTLHLREGLDEYLAEDFVRETIKHYSDYIAYPVVMPAGKSGGKQQGEAAEETLNSMKAVWKKSRGEVGDGEYAEFYHHVSHDPGKPLRVIHYAAEGKSEFRALLFVPEKAPFDLFLRDAVKGVHLYVRNVFITADCKELLPEYLRFVRGVVDSSDLPLNVSREMLQDDAMIRRIRKSLVARVLADLKELKDTQPDQYKSFYGEFGRVLKEGVHTDFENRDKLSELLLFTTTLSDHQPISLKEVVGRMPSSQKDIYYLIADSASAAENSPHLEALKRRGHEVLLMSDPIDPWVMMGLTEYDGHALKAVDRSDLDLAEAGETTDASRKRKTAAKELEGLLKQMQKTLDACVSEVRLSRRLTDSASCLVSDKHAMNPSMERLLRAMHQEPPPMRRILELNADHPVVARMQTLFEQDPADTRLVDYTDLVYDQALLAEGAPVRNPARFTRLVSDLMARAAG